MIATADEAADRCALSAGGSEVTLELAPRFKADTPDSMTDETDFKERPARWAIGGWVAALGLGAVCCLLPFWSDLGGSTGVQTREQGGAEVTFIVGGMMKSRSGAT